MSERVRIALVLVAVAVLAAPLAAQEDAVLEARVRRLAATRAALDDSTAAEARAAFDRQPRRYVTVDGVVFGFPAEVASDAERALAPLQGKWRVRYGEALALARADTALIWVEPRDSVVQRNDVVRWRFGKLEGSSVFLPGEAADGGELALVAPVIVRAWEFSLLDAELRAWLGGSGALPVGTLDPRPARTSLLLSPSGPARRCLTGSVHDCARSMGLTPAPDPFIDWYDPPELREVIRGMRIDPGIPGRAACLSGGDIDRCRSVLREEGSLLPLATGADVRASVYLYALEVGGSGALGRLHEARDRTTAEQLSVAAGIPVDSLLARWQRALVTAPARAAGSIGILVVALGWLVLLATLFAWRFRWHHV